MEHDSDVGCGGSTGDVGYMSGQAGMWSSCSKNAFMKHYTKLKLSDKWCLKGTYK